jgi:hypothetical protein
VAYGSGAGTGSTVYGRSSTAALARHGAGAGGGALESGAGTGGRLLSQGKLRRLVSRLQGCLSGLGPQETKVLVLRSGVGLKHGYGRRQVARILHVTLRQEGVIERRATAALTRASAEGTCGNRLASTRIGVSHALGVLVGMASRATAMGYGRSPVAASRTLPTPGRGSQPKAGQRPRPSGPNPKTAMITPPHDGGLDPLPLVLLIVAGLAALVWLLLGRHRLQPEPGAAGALPRARVLGHRTPAAALGAGRFGRGARAMAAALGLFALREAAVPRRNRRATGLKQRSPRPGLPSPSPRSNHSPPRGGNVATAGAVGALADRARAPASAADVPDKTREPSPASAGSEARPAGSPGNGWPLAEAAAAGAAVAGIESFIRGGALLDRGDLVGAEKAYRQAEEEGHPSAASNVGVLLEHRGDMVGAEAAYRRADERGDATGAFNLGSLLAERNDLVGAETAYRRADKRGDAAAAFTLATLMERRNDLFGAEAAYRRADERGHTSAPARLGMLLEQRGDMSGAEAAYLRADAGGDPTGSFKLGMMLEGRQDHAGAEAAYRRATDRDDGYVAELANAALSLLHRGR